MTKSRQRYLAKPAVWKLLASALSFPALAQQPAEGAADDALEEVVITGSRIASPNATSTSPIQVVSARDIQISGKADISDVLAQLPQNFNNSLGQDLGNRTSGLSNAGGVATADLRGLGPHRTLVLVDGRRLGQGSPNTSIQSPAPDLDQIPAALIERVDVVTGGASATYGSDAIAGVVNFIMKKNFEGFRVDGQLGVNWHDNQNKYAQQKQLDAGYTPLTGTTWDGHNKAFNLVAGTSIADGRGNVTAYFGYLQTDPVRSGDRDYGGCQMNINATLDDVDCGGSINSNYFEPLSGPNVGNVYNVGGTSLVDFGTTDTSPPSFFNSQKYIYIAREDVRYTAGFMGNVELNDYVRPYFEFNFMNDQTRQEIAPSGLFANSNVLDPAGNGSYYVNCSNPLLSAQQASILCTPAQIAADRLSPGSASAEVRIGRRNVEGGGRVSEFEHTNYRAVAGLKGAFASAWKYDAYGQYYYTTFYTLNDRYLSFQSITNALQATGTAAAPRCISGSPCVPYNIFREGGVTQDQLEYLYSPGTAYGTTTLRTVHGDVTGELGEYGVRSPAASDGIAINAGFEHRTERVKYAPDSGLLSGLLSGAGGASVAIDNEVSVDEQFIEVRAPLVQDRPGIKELVFDAGYRRSDYSLAGSVNTHKLELQYTPVQDLRFRGSYQRAIRAPSIVELFNPQLVGNIQIGADPCAPTRDPVTNALVAATRPLAECQRSGITAAQYGNGSTTNTIPQGTAGQLSQLQGGNPALKPETSTSYTIGLTFSPSALPNFTGSIDYYRIKLKGLVGALSAPIILNSCLDTGDPLYCSQLVRSSNGGLTGNSPATGGYILQTNVNIGAAEVSGIDVQSAYRLPLADRWGSLSFALNGAYLLSTKTTPRPGDHTYDCAGLFGLTCQTINPRWHHVLRTSWETPWDVTASLTWRFMSAVSQDNNDSDPTLRFAARGAVDKFIPRIPSFSYLDLSASWNLRKDLELRAGISNLLDKDPTLVDADIISGGAANSYETYDGLGRQMFLAFTAKF